MIWSTLVPKGSWIVPKSGPPLISKTMKAYNERVQAIRDNTLSQKKKDKEFTVAYKADKKAERMERIKSKPGIFNPDIYRDWLTGQKK